MIEIIIEAIIVGLLVMIIGIIVSYGTMYMQDPVLTKDFKHWWSIAFSFAISGMLVHIICEVSGVNRWYCKHGSACKKI